MLAGSLHPALGPIELFPGRAQLFLRAAIGGACELLLLFGVRQLFTQCRDTGVALGQPVCRCLGCNLCLIPCRTSRFEGFECVLEFLVRVLLGFRFGGFRCACWAYQGKCGAIRSETRITR